MKKHILTVTLNPAIDETVRMKNFAAGKDFLKEDVILSAGGKGVNVSRVIKHLNRKTLAMGFIGGPSGDFIKATLDAEKINNDFVRIQTNTRTSLTIIDLKSNKPTRILSKGPHVTFDELRTFRAKYNSLLKTSSFVVLSGRNAAGISDTTYDALISEAKKRNIKTLLDTHGKAFLCGLRAKPFCIKPNLEEAEAVIGEKLNSLAKLKKAISFFKNKGIELVIISLGAKGAIASDGPDVFLATPPKIKVRNSVGCGDAFVGSCVISIQDKRPMDELLALAVATGTANALSIKPGAITQPMVDKIKRTVKIRKV